MPPPRQPSVLPSYFTRNPGSSTTNTGKKITSDATAAHSQRSRKAAASHEPRPSAVAADRAGSPRLLRHLPTCLREMPDGAPSMNAPADSATSERRKTGASRASSAPSVLLPTPRQIPTKLQPASPFSRLAGPANQPFNQFATVLQAATQTKIRPSCRSLAVALGPVIACQTPSGGP